MQIPFINKKTSTKCLLTDCQSRYIILYCTKIAIGQLAKGIIAVNPVDFNSLFLKKISSENRLGMLANGYIKKWSEAAYG